MAVTPAIDISTYVKDVTQDGVITGGSGTVTSVALSGGTTGLTSSGGPVTTAGTLTLGGTLAVANGGTGATTVSGVQDALSLGRLLFTQTSTVTVTGTAAETSLLGTGVGSLTLAANFLTVGRPIVVTSGFNAANADVSDRSITFRVKVGGTDYSTLTLPIAAGETVYGFLNFLFTCTATGAPGSGFATTTISSGAFPPAGGSVVGNQVGSTVTTTGTNAITYTVQPSNSNITVNGYQFLLESRS